jgi:hypothetical protein
MRTRAYRFSGNTPAFPAQWFYGLFRALPGDRLVDTVAPEKRQPLRNLTPATGRQDHTTSPYASCAVRLHARLRPSLPAPTSVTIAIRPSCGRGITQEVLLICAHDQHRWVRQIGTTGKSAKSCQELFADSTRPSFLFPLPEKVARIFCEPDEGRRKTDAAHPHPSRIRRSLSSGGASRRPVGSFEPRSPARGEGKEGERRRKCACD